MNSPFCSASQQSSIVPLRTLKTFTVAFYNTICQLLLHDATIITAFSYNRHQNWATLKVYCCKYWQKGSPYLHVFRTCLPQENNALGTGILTYISHWVVGLFTKRPLTWNTQNEINNLSPYLMLSCLLY